jgi:peptide/nickel transport system ATP-binding protein
MALEPPSAGAARFEGRDYAKLSRRELEQLRSGFQMVFQDPYGSLDPRRRIDWIVAEPLSTQGVARERMRELVAETLISVGLRKADSAKYPHEFSGGQRQRIAIARALITRPRLIVADEPVSALDVSVQAQVLNLLADLQRDYGVTFLLISHDLAVVDHVCDEVAVMYRGRVVEQGPPGALFRSAAHPYTRALIAAVPKPIPGRRRDRAKLGAATAANGGSARRLPPPMGAQSCPYADRCGLAKPRCRSEPPPLRRIAADRSAACHFAEEVMALPQPG